MYLLENPVLQRELLVNLRMGRAFLLLAAYIALLGVLVYAAWPTGEPVGGEPVGKVAVAATSARGPVRLDLTSNPREAKQLVNLFFLGQYVLMSLMAPSFAAGTISGEKERKTYEMLLAGPLRPGAIVLGKLLASLAHLAVLVFCSLPMVMLCLPLGGVSPYEVLATYVAMAASVVTFGMISLSASSYFNRTVSALLVSYIIILPLTLSGVVFYRYFEAAASFRLVVLAGLFPAGCLIVCGVLFASICARLMRPPDVGSQGDQIVDLEQEQSRAVGMVINRKQFPDKLFAPPKRTELMSDRANPVYEKEMHSELFAQGTLMLRLVIQLSMFLGMILMAVFLFVQPELAPWYPGYVLVFSILVGPVFSAGAITSERERRTLELLLTTTLSPWQILSAKLYSSLRISCVLTSLLVWPLLLALLLPPWPYAADLTSILAYLVIIGLTTVTSTVLAMFFSVLCRKTSASLTATYLVLVVLFAVPVAAKLFADVFYPDGRVIQIVEHLGFLSPFAATFSLPITLGVQSAATSTANWTPYTCAAFLLFYLVLDTLLIFSLLRRFNTRWRVMR